MNTKRAALLVTAVILSTMPVFWMALLAVAQFNNLWLIPPYWREFLCIAAWWVGFVSSIVLALRSLRHGRGAMRSPILLSLVAIGLVGGVTEEAILWNNPKGGFPFGYFEVGILVWVAVALAAAMLPNLFSRHAA